MSTHFLTADGEQTTYIKGDLLIFKKRDMVWFSVKRSETFLPWNNSATAVIVPIDFEKSHLRYYVSGLLLESGKTASYVKDYSSDDGNDKEVVFQID
jgi:hypothetical protein